MAGRPSSETADAGGGTRRSLLRQERSRATRRLLVRTAARMWGEKGYDTVTVEEICAAAGVGRTTFYLHFKSKEALLAGLAGGTSSGVESDLGETADRPLDEQLEVFIIGVARRMAAVPKALAEEVMRSYRASGWTEPPSSPTFADVLHDVLVAAHDRGELAAGTEPAEMAELAAILGALTLDAIESWARRDTGADGLEAALRFRFQLVLARYRA